MCQFAISEDETRKVLEYVRQGLEINNINTNDDQKVVHLLLSAAATLASDTCLDKKDFRLWDYEINRFTSNILKSKANTIFTSQPSSIRRIGFN